MNVIDNLSQEPVQVSTLELADGTSAILTLMYQPTVQRWAFNLSWNDFVLEGVNLCVYPNVLREWRKLIPFGLTCVSTDNLDPLFIDDFSSGRVQLYILSEEDVLVMEETIFGTGVAP